LIIDRDPVGIHLGGAIGRPRVERRRLTLRNLLHFTEHFRGGGLIKLGLFLQAEDADGLQDSQGPERVRIGRVFRGFEGHRHVALGRQVVDLVGLNFLDDPNEIGRISQVSIVQFQPHIALVGVLVQVVDAIGIERGRAALHAVDAVAFFQQQFR
jgi:hypothetical protein